MQIRITNREVVILVIVSLMALAANLPDGAIGNVVDRRLLLVTLVATVVISLFRYLKFMLFLTVSVLAIGANLPEHLANQLGISQTAMIAASGMLVCVALLNKMYHLRPLKRLRKKSKAADNPKVDTIDSRGDVITAIVTGDFASLHQSLLSGVEINFRQNGDIPLFLAIEKGYADLVLLLLSHGASLKVRNKEGKTPIEFALLNNEIRIAEIIRYASKQNLAVQSRTVFPVSKKSKMVILFADICGSTALYDKLGNDSALHVITHTLNILTQEVAAHKGVLIKTIGDEIMCSFPNIVLATQAASAMHRAIDARRPGGTLPIFVRIGFHYGEVIHKENDVFGDAVNIAARVTAVTRARQIMTTQTVVDALPNGFADKTRPVMRAAFRGKQDSFAIFQILWEQEGTIFGRVGQTAFRKPDENANAAFSGNRTIQHPEQQYDQTITPDKTFPDSTNQLTERQTP
ncbi:MAG: adenylate/guanylate cyclase domain-containing protein [Sideroxyarcus sp.]